MANIWQSAHPNSELDREQGGSNTGGSDLAGLEKATATYHRQCISGAAIWPAKALLSASMVAPPFVCAQRAQHHPQPALVLCSAKSGNGASTVQLSVAQTFQLGLLCGAVAGFTVDAVLFPLDTLKTRLQVVGGSSGGGGAAALFRGLYRGFAPAVAASAPAAAAFFGSYDYAKRQLESRIESKPVAHALAAACGDVVSSTVRLPFEVVKQQMQSGMHAGVGPAVRSIWRTQGASGFLAGYRSLILRELPFDALQFPLYELFKRKWAAAKRQPLTTVESSACGSAAGAIAAAVTTPLDVVKTRMMTQTTAGPKYNGVVHALRKIAADEGVHALFSGIAPRVMWISIGGAVFFGAYEASRKVFLPVFVPDKREELF